MIKYPSRKFDNTQMIMADWDTTPLIIAKNSSTEVQMYADLNNG